MHIRFFFYFSCVSRVVSGIEGDVIDLRYYIGFLHIINEASAPPRVGPQ